MSKSIFHNQSIPLIRFYTSSFLAVPFLNLMSNLEERAGGVVIRLGGNTQEYAAMVDSLPKGLTFSKSVFASNQTVSFISCNISLFFIFFSQTQTPAVVYTIDMFYMTANISSMLNVKWFLGMCISLHQKIPLLLFRPLGIPFNDSVDWRLTIAEKGQQILGDNLLGLQAGNEPDFYATFVASFLFHIFLPI